MRFHTISCYDQISRYTLYNVRGASQVQIKKSDIQILLLII